MFGWRLERLVVGEWLPLGGRMSYANAWDVLVELSDWEINSPAAVGAFMRCEGVSPKFQAALDQIRNDKRAALKLRQLSTSNQEK